MFADYKLLVVQDYQQKKVANTLSPRLARPTPANIREECMAVYSERYLRKDDNHLRTFFGQSGNSITCARAIEQCEIDKFRPLVNFLKNPAIKTEDKNIELLAWLIDFEPRPHEYGRKYTVNADISENEKEQPGSSDEQKEVTLPEKLKDDSVQTLSGKPYFKLKTIAVIAAVIILLFTSALMYWSRNNKSATVSLDGQQCMYWAGDHYEPVSCNQQFGIDTLVIALDSLRLYNFKKINTPDTITRNAIGKVWYIKLKNKLEFYTADGYYPADPKLRVKPITDYIINKYILVSLGSE